MTHQLELRPGPANGSIHYDLLSRLDLPPGRSEIRVAVSSPTTGRTGSAYLSVTIPDLTKEALTLSGVVLESREAVVHSAVKDGATLVPLAPTTVRDFARTDQPTAFVRVFQGGKKSLVPVRVTARIVNEEDRPVFEEHTTAAAESFGADRSADYRLTLPLAGLDPGEYLVSIAAVAGQSSVRRDVRITVK